MVFFSQQTSLGGAFITCHQFHRVTSSLVVGGVGGVCLHPKMCDMAAQRAQRSAARNRPGRTDGMLQAMGIHE